MGEWKLDMELPEQLERAYYEARLPVQDFGVHEILGPSVIENATRKMLDVSPWVFAPNMPKRDRGPVDWGSAEEGGITLAWRHWGQCTPSRDGMVTGEREYSYGYVLAEDAPYEGILVDDVEVEELIECPEWPVNIPVEVEL